MKRIVVAACILVLLLGGAWAYRGKVASKAVPEGPRTARVTRGNLVSSVSATGTLRPYSYVEVRSRSTGTVTEVHVQEGDPVQKGQLLVLIDDRDARAEYEIRQSQLASALARAQQAQSQLATARAQNATRIAEAESALATSNARLAQLLAGSRPEQIDQSRESVRQAELSLESARLHLARTQELHSGGLVSKASLDQAQNQYDSAQAQLRAAQARLRELTAGSRPEEIEVARAQVRQAEASVAQARAARLGERSLEAEVRSAEAQVRTVTAQEAQARDRLGETRIVAPIAGIVARQLVQAGQSVIGGLTGGGTLVMTIADVQTIQAQVGVDESDVAQLAVGMSVRITADALPRRTFEGRITRIAPHSVVVQNVTQYEVVVDVDNPDPALRLGMSVDAEFIISERLGVPLVPAEAIRGQDAKVVILVDGKKLTPVVVRTGASDGRQVEIVEGAELGQTVYLGPARQNSTTTSQPRPANPFAPRFPARPSSPPAR